MKDVEAVAHAIVDSAIKVHRALGPGLLESVYQQCLAYELTQAGLAVACEVNQPVTYREIEIQTGFRIDMLVKDCLIVENKTVEKLLPIHEAQLLTYLRLRNLRVGFLLNWNVLLMKYGIKRMVNG
jgi:GxxExxY protein